ncbi:MAG: lipopolysaccharide biosynthesis protein [Chitinophagaceae bacterium]|jgi:O-antigen/teichoic acid export membrane protein
MSKVSRNIKNSVYNVADVVLYPVSFFATIPFFMRQMGEEIFGLWMLINTLIVAFQVFNLGLGPAVMKFTALYTRQNETSKLSQIISGGLSFSFMLLLLSLSAGFIISYFTGNGTLFKLPVHLRETAAAAVAIAGCIIGLKFTEQTLLHVFKGLERFDLYFHINNGIKFLILLINMVQAYYSQPLTAMLTVNIILTLIMLPLQIIILRKLLPGYLPLFSLKMKELFSFGFYVWVQTVIVIIVFQVDRFIVISFAGPAELGYYAVVSTLFINIHGCITATVSWLIPRIGSISEHESSEKKIYQHLAAFVLCIGLCTLLLFFICYKPLIEFWAGNAVLLRIKDYLLLFLAFELFYMLLIAPSMFITYSGHIKTGVLITYLTSFMNIAGMIAGFLITKSITGMVEGLLFSTVAAMCIVYTIVNKKLFHKFLPADTAFFLLLPALFCIMIYVHQTQVSAIIILLLALLYGLYFFKIKKLNFRVLFH